VLETTTHSNGKAEHTIYVHTCLFKGDDRVRSPFECNQLSFFQFYFFFVKFQLLPYQPKNKDSMNKICKPLSKKHNKRN